MKLTQSEAAWIFRGLAGLIHAGLPLADGVYLLSQEETGEKRRLLEALGAAMDKGLPLEDAMEESAAFAEAAVALIRMGQTTGRLEDTLFYLAEFYEEQVRTRRRIKNALGYPALIMALMLTVMGVLLTEVLPVFQRVYASLGSGLTGTAQWLLNLGQGLKQGLPALLAALILGLMGFLAFTFVPAIREKGTAWGNKTFGDKGFARKFNNAQFAYALAMGLGSGLGLEESVTLAGRLLAHIPEAAARCEDCARQLAEGVDLHLALERSRLLPPAMSRMLSVGLRSGSAEQTMADIAQRLSRDARESLEDGISKVEPAMVLICSVLVGVILLAVMLPLMDIMAAIG